MSIFGSIQPFLKLFDFIITLFPTFCTGFPFGFYLGCEGINLLVEFFDELILLENYIPAVFDGFGVRTETVQNGILINLNRFLNS